MKYTQLHLHSENSILDGVSSIKEIVDRSIELGHTAVAVTDHGNINATMSLSNECNARGIKPIMGGEFYFAKDSLSREKGGGRFHLILLAKNKVGWKNLLQLNAHAHQKGFYVKPRIDFKTLEKFHEGIICLSGCASGIVAANIVKDKPNKASKWAKKFKNVFGNDFYLEMQVSDFHLQPKVNQGLLEISRNLKIPTVITTDAHYANKEDAILQDMMILIMQKKTWKDRTKAIEAIERGEKVKMPWEISSKQLWMKSYGEMKDSWKKWHSSYMDKETFIKSMKESSKIEDKIEHWELDKEPKYPVMDTGDKTMEQVIRDFVVKGFKWRGVKGTVYEKRSQYELEIIIALGLDAYFVILADAIWHARGKGISVGVGRGSAAGSLVCYLLGITGLDPILHDLMFERFINPGRKEMPDIDVDFESARRDEVKQYLVSKYGEDRVAEVTAFQNMKLKSSLKDVSRVMGGNFTATNKLTSSINDGKIKDVTTLEELEELYPKEIEAFISDHEVHEKVLKIAMKLMGRIRNMSKHPAGVVITPTPLSSLVALQRKGDKVNVGWTEGTTRKELTPNGFVKYDILAIKTLDILYGAVKMIEKRHGIKIDIDKLPLDDKKVYEKMSKGRSLGSFQFETPNMQRMLKAMRADTFEDLAALNALDRPGPLDGGMDIIYNKMKNGEEDEQTLELIKPAMRKLLPKTYGVIVFQEQVLETAKKLAGFSLEEADKLRKALMKKEKDVTKEKARKKMIKVLKVKFLEGAVKNVKQKDAEFIWESMYKFARYGFNRSHSVSYAYIGYQCMWLKVNYPIEFFCSILNFSDKVKTLMYVKDALRYKIKVLPVDINKSTLVFRPQGKNIRYPISHLKYISKAGKAIVDSRPYEDFNDFIKKIKGHRVNKNAVMSLIRAGAFDKFGKRWNIMYKFMKMKAKKKDRDKIKKEVWSTMQILENEKLAYEFEFSDSVLEELFVKLHDNYECSSIQRAFELGPGNVVRVGGIVRKVREHKAKGGVMAFIDIQFFKKSSSVTLFADSWEKLKDKITTGSLVYGNLKVNEYKGKLSFMLSTRDNCYLRKLELE